MVYQQLQDWARIWMRTYKSGRVRPESKKPCFIKDAFANIQIRKLPKVANYLLTRSARSLQAQKIPKIGTMDLLIRLDNKLKLNSDSSPPPKYTSYIQC